MVLFFKKNWVIVIVLLITSYGIISKLDLIPQHLNMFKMFKSSRNERLIVVDIRNRYFATNGHYGEVYADLFTAFDDVIKLYGDTFEIHKAELFKKYPLLRQYYDKYDDLLLQKKEIDILKLSIDSNENDYKQAFDRLKKTEDDLINFAQKNNLVYIGRGYVRAGIDFRVVQSENIDTLTEKILVMSIPNPQIFDTIINPYYIRTEKEEILGYEIFVQKRRDYSDDEVKLVKDQCKIELARSAIEKGILDNAAMSGKSALERDVLFMGFDQITINFKQDDKQNNITKLH